MKFDTESGCYQKITIALAMCLFAAACPGAETASPRLPDSKIESGNMENQEELRICLLVDQGLSSETVDSLVLAIGDELAKSRIKLSTPWMLPWERQGFTRDGLLSEISKFPLEAPCDRIVALVGRNFGDFLYGITIGIEVLGSVEQVTHTHGYIVAERASINQIFVPPSSVAAHETKHLLGCKDGDSPAQCEGKVLRIKEAARQNRKNGNNFFPGQSLDDQMISDRDLCDLLLGLQFNQEELEAALSIAPPVDSPTVRFSAGANPGI